MEIDPKKILNAFFKIPTLDFLGWRTDEDYIYEYTKYLSERRNIIIPDHAVVLTDGDLVGMIKRCRIIFTTGPSEIFKSYFQSMEMLAKGGGYKIRHLSDIKERYESYWNH